jgi:tetratricopeptide (TPR) repeat protein
MIDMSGSVLSGLRESARGADQKMVEALDSRLAEDERVVSRLSASGTLVHEDDGETTERGGGDGGVLFVATDRKLVFVLDTPTGRQTADIPYTDVKDASVDSGFLSTTVSVRVWGRGTFRLSPSKADDVSEIVAYITTASDLWQRVVAALQDARQHGAVLETAREDGREADAEDAHESALSCIETARERAEGAPVPLRDAIDARIEAAETDLRRARMESRVARGRALAAQTTPVTETGDYDGTAADLSRAREHFERALQIATAEGFDAAPTIQDEIAALDDRLATLGTQPLARAEDALARAQAASDTEECIERWEETLERYRETLEAGWGMAVPFDGDTDALRYQLAWLVAKVIELHTDRAETLVAGDDDVSESDAADTREEAAKEHLVAAHRLASQYHAGDAAALTDRLDTVRTTPTTGE